MGVRRPRPSLPGPHEHLSATFPAQPQSAPAVREWASRELQNRGKGTLSPDVALLLSELVTNAMKYTQGDIVVEIDADSQVIVGVCDHSSQEPFVRPTPGSEDGGGRGLHLVDALAEQWGAELYQDGKCVWFQVSHP